VRRQTLGVSELPLRFSSPVASFSWATWCASLSLVQQQVVMSLGCTVEPWNYVKMMMEVGFVNVEFVDSTSFKTTTITVGARCRAKRPADNAVPRSPAAVSS